MVDKSNSSNPQAAPDTRGLLAPPTPQRAAASARSPNSAAPSAREAPEPFQDCYMDLTTGQESASQSADIPEAAWSGDSLRVAIRRSGGVAHTPRTKSGFFPFRDHAACQTPPVWEDDGRCQASKPPLRAPSVRCSLHDPSQGSPATHTIGGRTLALDDLVPRLERLGIQSELWEYSKSDALDVEAAGYEVRGLPPE